MAGLILGKPIGIVSFCWLATKIGLARMPGEINAKILIGAGCLAGIGFTMSLFIAGLAVSGDHLEEAKIGIFAGVERQRGAGLWAVVGLLAEEYRDEP